MSEEFDRKRGTAEISRKKKGRKKMPELDELELAVNIEKDLGKKQTGKEST